MRTKVIRRGDELVVVIPEDELTLEKLLEGITEENRHPETDWGPDVGNERWEY